MTVILIIYTSLMACFSLAPFVKSDYWIFRICEYPRIQKLILTGIALMLLAVFYDRNEPVYLVMMIAMIVNAIYLYILILPFTILGKKQVLRAERDLPEQSVSIMIANVLQENKAATECLEQIRKTDPDVLLLLEGNDRWREQMSLLEEDYAYKVLVPLENTYGMLLYSKLQLTDPQVKYMVEDHVPSIHTDLILRNGQKVRLFAVHPSPPAPQVNPRSTERDAELLMIADLAKAATGPVIVIGDLNDVAWSFTTKLFLKMSKLLDPRRGRGFFNSFDARNPIMRFPLDHAFISTDFKLKSMERLENCGSDHFPIFIRIQYEEQADRQQEPMDADADDHAKADEKKAAV